MASTRARKPREMAGGAHLDSSFLFSLGPQPLGWCYPPIFCLQLSLLGMPSHTWRRLAMVILTPVKSTEKMSHHYHHTLCRLLAEGSQLWRGQSRQTPCIWPVWLFSSHPSVLQPPLFPTHTMLTGLRHC